MGFNDPNRPKILRTALSEDTLKRFKALAATKDITMADYLEQLIKDAIEKGAESPIN